MSASSFHAAVIGGGISGLATAYYLEQAARAQGLPLTVDLLERSSRLGGKIVTVRRDGFVIEGGPDSFVLEKPSAVDLCRDLGITDRILPSNPDQQRVFVIHKNRLRVMPAGFQLAAPTRWLPFFKTRLLSPWGKARAAMDVVIPRRRAAGDESLAHFIRRRLGREVLDTIAGPIMGGIHVADPERLSMAAAWPRFVELEQTHRSLIRGLARARARREASSTSATPRSAFASLAGGMDELVQAVAGALNGAIKTDCHVTRIEMADGGLLIHDATGGSARRADAVVLTVPSGDAARLLGPLEPALPAALKAIRHVGTATVSLGYRPDENGARDVLKGYGLVVPDRERRVMSACSFVSTKFDGRAPAGSVLVRGFVGGDGYDDVLAHGDDDLTAMVREEVASRLDLRGEPVVRHVSRWPNGNPQYDVGHLDRVAVIEGLVNRLPGVYVTGCAYRGVGLPDCIRQAKETAERLCRDATERRPFAAASASR